MVKDIVKTSKIQEKEPIRLVCIGKEAYAKPTVSAFPQNIKTPTIYEKEDGQQSFVCRKNSGNS